MLYANRYQFLVLAMQHGCRFHQGKAEFKPARLSELDIVNGTATVQVLGFSPTVVLQLQPLGTVFDRTPLQFEQ
jgi:hypothetical protein